MSESRNADPTELPTDPAGIYVRDMLRLVVEGPFLENRALSEICRLEAAETLVDCENAENLFEAFEMIDAQEREMRKAVFNNGEA